MGRVIKYEGGAMDTATAEKLKAFVRGDLTWAEVEGMTFEEAKAIAQVGCDLAAAGRYEEARILFEGLVEGNPKDSASRAALGTVYQKLGRLEDAQGANALLIGIAPAGGRIPAAWRPIILDAIARGWEVISGLHEFLADDAEFAAAAAKHGARLVDVRRNDERDVARGEGFREGCLRIETVGQDCSVGKMVVAVDVARALQRRGHDAKFVATGQTGIMVEGDGCPVDCVVADFISGAAEKLVLVNQHHDILLIEGQGSLVHPLYSGVTLSLLHGSAPQALILCYEVGREVVTGVESVKIPPLAEIKKIYDVMANIHQKCQCVGIGINGRKLNAEQAARERERIKAEFGLPACDVVRDGPDELVEAILAFRNKGGWESP